jgi:lipoate-protein ligase A
MDTWRLITTFGADPGFNMGLDEALLEDELAPPTLRLYTWEPDTLSLGYFQKFAEVPAASGIDGRTPGALVRRITGGGAIHHVHELTFSFVAPATHALYQGPIVESYKRVHAAIAAALGELGIGAELRGDFVIAYHVPVMGRLGYGIIVTNRNRITGATDSLTGADARNGVLILEVGTSF